MRYFVFLFFIIINFSYAGFDVLYYDKNITSDIQSVVDKKFKPASLSYTFGKKKAVWLKINLKNSTAQTKEFFIALSEIQIMEDVHFYTLKNDKVIKSNTSWHKYKNPDTKHRIGKNLIYKNTLQVDESNEIYIFITAKSNIFYTLFIGEEHEVLSKISNSSSLLLFMVGILGSLGIFYLFLFFLTPNKEYFYYVMFVFSSIVWAMYMFGGYAQFFDLFGYAYLVNVFIYLFPVFILLFLKTIYKNSSEFSKFIKYINIFIVLLLFVSMVYILGRVSLIPYFSAGIFGPVVYLFSLFFIMTLSLIIYKKRLPYSGIFLLAFSFNFIGSLMSISFFLGLVPNNFFTMHSNILGIVFEAIILSILLTTKFNEINKQKDHILSLSKIKDLKIQTMSNTINFVAHQWRQPLSQINSAVLLIDDEVYRAKLKNQIIDEKLTEIEKMTRYMSKTIDDFRSLYSSNTTKQKINLKHLFDKSISILQSNIEKNGIKVECKIDEKIDILAYENDLEQLFLIVLNNAIDSLISNNSQDPKIIIKAKDSHKTLHITIYDNGGGVQIKNIQDIFEPNITTKERSKGTGLGLFMAKLIIENKLEGSIDVKNIKNGALFELKFPHKEFK